MPKSDKENNKKQRSFYWYLEEEKLVTTILMAIKANHNLTEFTELLRANTKDDPLNQPTHEKRQGGIIKPLTEAQAASRFRRFKKDYGYRKLRLRRDYKSKKELHQEKQAELKEKYGAEFELLNKSFK